MRTRPEQLARFGLLLMVLVWVGLVAPVTGFAAPYAAMVIDARSGKVLHSRNADTQLHPASLTKMMTLYIAFEAVEHGEISLDTVVTVSAKAAAEPPSKLGLQAGQRIKLRYLIRAAAVKSANDAATAIGEAISGSEAAFARRMNRTAAALGMTRTQFKNANGLTEAGHLSTARDMTTLGRHLFFDYPEYYNLFSRRSTDAGIKTVSSTNRRFLDSYEGADGIKTGYTRAAGFNLVASAERGGERIIATVFGGRSSATRNAKVAELLDLGFRRAPTRVALRPPPVPAYLGETPAPGAAGKIVRVTLAVERSPRPVPRPTPAPLEPSEDLIADLQDSVTEALADVTGAAAADTLAPAPPTVAIRPRPRPETIVLASAGPVVEAPLDAPEIITRMSSSGGRHWGVNVGRYGSQYEAERVLLRTALKELETLDEALRKVVARPGGFDANFVGLSEEEAALACRRLTARNSECRVIGPG